MRTTFTFRQPEGGYRANQDAVLLAEFALSERGARHAIDLGAGAGLVGLTLLAQGVPRVTFVENEAASSAAAEKNLAESGWQERGTVHTADVVKFANTFREKADLVVVNPPYFEPGRGRVPVDARRASARMGSLAHFVEAAQALVGSRSRVAWVYPAREILLLTESLRKVGLEPKRIRFVHGRAKKPARVALVEAQPGKRGGLVVEPPLVEYA